METAVQQAPPASPNTPKSPLSPTDIPYIRDLVMTACKKDGESIIRIDRLHQTLVDMKTAYHVADGPFKGIIINRATKVLPIVEDPDVRMEFLVHMTDVKSKNGNDYKEVRDLRFWFKPQADPKARSVSAQEYFKALLQPEAFPRDYVQFIKKCIVLTQHFPMVKRIELVLKPAEEDEPDEPIIKPRSSQEVRAAPSASAPRQQEAPNRWNIADEIIEDSDSDGEEMIDGNPALNVTLDRVFPVKTLERPGKKASAKTRTGQNTITIETTLETTVLRSLAAANNLRNKSLKQDGQDIISEGGPGSDAAGTSQSGGVENGSRDRGSDTPDREASDEETYDGKFHLLDVTFDRVFPVKTIDKPTDSAPTETDMNSNITMEDAMITCTMASNVHSMPAKHGHEGPEPSKDSENEAGENSKDDVAENEGNYAVKNGKDNGEEIENYMYSIETNGHDDGEKLIENGVQGSGEPDVGDDTEYNVQNDGADSLDRNGEEDARENRDYNAGQNGDNVCEENGGNDASENGLHNAERNGKHQSGDNREDNENETVEDGKMENGYYANESDHDSQDGAAEEESYENYITVLTPAVYDYQYLPEVPVSDKSHITFRLRAKCDAHIALSSVYGDTERKTYELLIGGWDNSKSVIRYGGQGEVMEETITTDILDGDEFRTFWVSWDRGMVQVGEGRRRGIDTFLRWQVPDNKKHSINCLAVSSGPGSSGEWEFVEIINSEHFAFLDEMLEIEHLITGDRDFSLSFEEDEEDYEDTDGPQKPEDTTKAARRARFRMSLLWLAKKQKMLQVLEDAYPNSVNTGDLLKMCNIKLHDMMTSVVYLKDLQKRGLITEVTRGIWMRSPAAQDKSHVVKMVETVPALTSRETPTIAIITSQYCEKLAVDAMIENKTSYVKYKTEGNVVKGESQVYTLGRIGSHPVVSTKLSRVGSAQSASISAGNTVTRLLGIFDKVQHVLVVGCAGAVPHYSDYEKHVRLGDIVVSVPAAGRSDGPLYIHCDRFDQLRNGRYEFTTNYWSSFGESIHQQVEQMQRMASRSSYGRKPWERYMDEGHKKLHSEESNFHRPPAKKDRLFAVIENEVVQVEHPKPSKGYDKNEPDNKTRVRYGPIGSGKYIARNDRLRMDFAQEFSLAAYDCEFGAVLDSVEGSQKKSFLLIKGISDYVDGTRNKEWQPFAALAAASYMKAIISALPSMRRY